MNCELFVGIDLGGTKIAAIGLDESGNDVATFRVPTPRNDYAATIEAIANLVARVETAAGREGRVGVGTPGSVSPSSGLIRNANSVWLNGQPLHRDLEQRLGRSVRLANDANCFALSEALNGAGRNAATVFGVILGTGCGGGIVVDGRCLAGRQAIAGEWGHNPLPWADETEIPGPVCWCGRRGCNETWLSGPAIVRDHAAVTGDHCTVEEIAVLARDGDQQAQATFDRHLDRLGRGLAAVVNIIDPDVIVLGGGLSNLAHLYRRLPARIVTHLFADHSTLEIAPPRFGDDSGMRGAAWLWRDTGDGPPMSG